MAGTENQENIMVVEVPRKRKSVSFILPIESHLKSPNFNDYSQSALTHLSSMPETEDAAALLEQACLQKITQRLLINDTMEVLVPTEPIETNQVLIEMTGFVSMDYEVKARARKNCVFMYDELPEGRILIDTRGDLVPRRSCRPNAALKHVLKAPTTLGMLIVATKDIPENEEVTLPFDADWKDSDVPIDCRNHMGMIQECPYEKERVVAAEKRERKKKLKEAERAEKSSGQGRKADNKDLVIKQVKPKPAVTSSVGSTPLPKKKAPVVEAEAPTPEAKEPISTSTTAPKRYRLAILGHLIQEIAALNAKASEFQLPEGFNNLSLCSPWIFEAKMKFLEAKKAMGLAPPASVRLKKRPARFDADKENENENAGAKRRCL